MGNSLFGIVPGHVYFLDSAYKRLFPDCGMRDFDRTLSGAAPDAVTDRPCLCVKHPVQKVLWFVPISSKIEKYRALRIKKILLWGRCDTIYIGPLHEGRDNAFLMQNMFPAPPHFVKNEYHYGSGKPVMPEKQVYDEIQNCADNVFRATMRGRRLMYTDIQPLLDYYNAMVEHIDTATYYRDLVISHEPVEFACERG